jgi:hypothetical protein
MMNLQGPDKTYPLKASLKLIAAVEEGYGSLHALAEDLLEKTLPLSEMIEIVKTLYRYAGCMSVDDEFLLQQPCTEILITFLLDVLGPIERAATPPTGAFMDEMVKKFPDGGKS